MRKRAPRWLSSPRSNPGYLEAVRLLPCCAPGAPDGCSGHADPHHAGRRPGVGLKCPDTEAIPFCRAHHSAWHGGYGVFRGWTRQERRQWADARIAETQRRVFGIGFTDAETVPF